MNNQIMLSKQQKNTLIKDLLKSGVMLRIQVTGFSMEPFLSNGDIVKIQKVKPDALLPGDLVFFINQQECLVLHRLIKKKKAANGTIRLQTKGDALFYCDELFKPDHLIGKVCMIEKMDSARQINLESLQSRIISYLFALFQRFKINILFFMKPGLHVMR
jgi:signal peptidase I